MPAPNLLFIYTDEQRYDTMAAYGNTHIEMPNLNRFAETATVFEEAYVTQPVCTPSRSSLLTGLYPHTNGCIANNVPLSPDTPCLPEMLTEGNYTCAHHGKWHLGDEIFPQHGFSEWRAIEDMYRPYYRPGKPRDELSHYQRWLREQGLEAPEGDFFNRSQAAKLPEEYSKPAYLAREATRFLRKNHDNPFVLFVNFLEPHMPFTGPRDDQYEPESIPLPDNFEAVPGADQPLRLRAGHAKWHNRFQSEQDFRRLIARYWGLCSQVDTYFGRIMDVLEELGLADNTVVVYTSDHGDMMGSHGMVAKTVMYQESVRVPLLVRVPGQREGHRVSGPISQIDLVPTLLDVMRQPVPEALEGKSLRQAAEGTVTELDQDIVIEWNGSNGYSPNVELPDATKEQILESWSDPVRTLVTAQGWRFTCSPLGEHELYDLNVDPGETTNLAARAEHLPLMRRLRGRIAAAL